MRGSGGLSARKTSTEGAPRAVSAAQLAPPLPNGLPPQPAGEAISAERIGPLPLVAPPIPRRRRSSVGRPTDHSARRDNAFPRWLRIVDQIHGSALSIATLAADALVATAAGAMAGLGRFGVVGLPVLVVVTFTAAGLYTRRTSLETQGVGWYAARVVGPLLAVVVVLTVVLTPQIELRMAALLVTGLVALRTLTWALVVTSRRRARGLRRTMVIGREPMARTVVAKLLAFPEAGLLPVDVLRPADGAGRFSRLPDDLPSVVREHAISHFVLMPEGDRDGIVADCIARCDGLDVSFSMLPPLAELFLNPGLVTQVGGLPLIALGTLSRSQRGVPGKRLFDLVAGSVLLVLAAPVMVVTAAAIWAQDRGPILFRQRRVGQGGRTFAMLKFRSMVVGADRLLSQLQHHNVTNGLLFKMEQDPRVTTVGRIIRRFSIDELPQLINVLKGQMSLVGPRPLPVDPEDFGALDGKRHCVRPGITGYWQISGSTGLTYDEMVKLDFAYINNWSVWLDARLLARTVPALFNRRGPC